MTEEHYIELYDLGNDLAKILHEIISIRIETLEDEELTAFYDGLRDNLILDVQ